MAVLTYLRRILESLDHPDMINLVLHYLLALPEALASREGPSTSSISDARKRKSMDLATMMAEKSSETVTPLLFNLVDLILACLRSRNQQTIHVTLQLVSAILKRHHRYAVITLLKTEVLPANTADRTVGAHEQEVEYMVGLASSIGGHGDFDEIYGNILKDTTTRLESHPCSLRLLVSRVSTSDPKLPVVPDSLPGAPRDVRDHTLRADDPLLNATLDLLETFFINPVEMNLSVTETVVDLAICGYMSIEGWLARSPKTYSFAEEDNEAGDATAGGQEERGDDTSVSIGELGAPSTSPSSGRGLSASEAQRLKALARCRRRPQWNRESVPRMLSLLQRLCDQVSSFKEMIPRFEELLQQRREAFQTAETMLDHPPPTRKASPASQSTPERPSPDRAGRAGSPSSRPSALEGFAQRFLLELGTPSRSVSPRGRKDPGRSSGASTSGTTPGLSESSIPRAPRAPPKEFHINYADPNKSGTSRNFSPSSARSDLGSATDLGEASAASQAAAFAAIDQSILARLVGLPDDKLKPIPIKLDRWPTSNSAEATGSEDRPDRAEGSGTAGAARASVGTAEDVKAGTPAEETKVSVSHVITNVIIFQSFLLELAGLMQVRAGLFGEVRYA